MTNKEAVNWLINITADIGKTEHRDLWHYEQALTEIKDMLESEQPKIVRCGECKWWTKQKNSGQGRCELLGIYPTGGWYCANGAEERTDG